MKRMTLAAFALIAACSAPTADGPTNTARDVDDARPETTKAAEKPGVRPVADRMRALDRTVYKVSVDGLPAIGSAAAPLTVVLFSDYECTYCRRLEPQLEQLRAEHGSDVRIVLAPHPLPMHKQARPAALALIAAAEQDKVEAMHKGLVALDGKLDDESIARAAREAGLDVGRFDADRKSAKAEKTLEKAEALAARFSVTGTPTTFLNGIRITGAQPEVVRELGEEQLAAGRERRVGYDTLVASGLEKAEPDPTVSAIRIGGEAGRAGDAPAHFGEVKKCGAVKSVELTVGADGKLLRAVTDPPELGACVAKAASGWTFGKGEGEAKFKLVLR